MFVTVCILCAVCFVPALTITCNVGRFSGLGGSRTARHCGSGNYTTPFPTKCNLLSVWEGEERVHYEGCGECPVQGSGECRECGTCRCNQHTLFLADGEHITWMEGCESPVDRLSWLQLMGLATTVVWVGLVVSEW